MSSSTSENLQFAYHAPNPLRQISIFTPQYALASASDFFGNHRSPAFQRVAPKLGSQEECNAAIRHIYAKRDKTLRYLLYGAAGLILGGGAATGIISLASHYSKAAMLPLFFGIVFGVCALSCAGAQYLINKKEPVYQAEIESTLLNQSADEQVTQTIKHFKTDRTKNNLLLGGAALLMFEVGVAGVLLGCYDPAVSFNVQMLLGLGFVAGIVFLGKALYNPDPGAEELQDFAPRASS